MNEPKHPPLAPGSEISTDVDGDPYIEIAFSGGDIAFLYGKKLVASVAEVECSRRADALVRLHKEYGRKKDGLARKQQDKAITRLYRSSVKWRGNAKAWREWGEG